MSSWRDAVEKAEHYLAIGQTEIYLHGDGERPWGLVTAAESGGGHRLDMDTTVWLRAEHPCGITFKWTLEMETRTANGKGYYEIDRAGIRGAMARMSPAGRAGLRAHLARCAEAVLAKANEWQEHVESQRADAAVLAELAAQP